jgi:peroxiredoxin
MSLRDRLDQQAARWSEGLREIYLDLARHLETSAAGEGALQVGGLLPDFLLPNAEGRLISAADLLARGPVVVCFFRGEWCPFCGLTLAALEEALPRIAAAGATLVALTPETGGLALRAKHRFALHFEVLCDVDNAVALQFGVMFRAPDFYRRMLESFRIDLGARHGNDSWLLPMPAAFVADRHGVLRYAYVSGDVRTRAEPDVIVQVLEGI